MAGLGDFCSKRCSGRRHSLVHVILSGSATTRKEGPASVGTIGCGAVLTSEGDYIGRLSKLLDRLITYTLRESRYSP
jgi:hypothetical protein